MFGRLLNYFVVLALVGLFMSCSSGEDNQGSQSSSKANEQIGEQSESVAKSGTVAQASTAAPGFSRPDVLGNETVNFADYSGKVVLVDFWATWCPPCRRSIPVLSDLHNKYSDQGFAVVGISLDTKGPEEVAKFAENFRIPYSVIMGDADMAKKWNLGRSIPTAFLVDRQGKVVNKIVGFKDMGYYENLIKQYL